MNIKKELKYTKTHEWVKIEGNIATIGLTDYAQGEMGDIVFVELPSIGDSVTSENTVGAVESVKTASDYYAPVSGVVTEVNEALEDAYEVINSDPYGDGWLIKIEMEDPSQADSLLTAEKYEEMVG